MTATRSKNKATTKPTEPETAAPALEIVNSEPTTETPTQEAAPVSTFDRLMEQYSTAHIPDTTELTLEDGTKIPCKLLKSSDAYAGIETRTALIFRLCQHPARVKAELPDLLPFLPIDYLTLRDAVTVQDCCLPPFAFTLAQAVQAGKTCGSLLSDLAGEIRRMSEPDAWPKPAITPTHTPETNATDYPAQDTQDAPHDAQEAA